MFKRNIVTASILSGSVLVTLCLFADVTPAQTVKPVKGIVVIVQKEPGDTSVRAPRDQASGQASGRRDTIVQKELGNTAAGTATTDSSGNFKFPVLPIGSYSLTLSLPENQQTTTHSANGTGENRKPDVQSKPQASQAPMPGGLNRDPSTAQINTFLISILGAEGGERNIVWNHKTNTIIDVTSAATERNSSGHDKVTFQSDGVHPVGGSARHCGGESNPCEKRPNIKDN